MRASAALVGLVVLAGCTSDASAPGPAEAGAAARLAPSQTTPDTAAAPGLPPPCAVTDLSLTFRTDPAGVPTAASIAIHNVASTRCEVQLDGSPGLDPDIEPDVWLDAGDAATLEVELDATSCRTSEVLDRVPLVLGGDAVDVPIEPIALCGFTFVALYPGEPG